MHKYLYWTPLNLLVTLETVSPYILYLLMAIIRKTHVMWINYWI